MAARDTPELFIEAYKCRNPIDLPNDLTSLEDLNECVKLQMSWDGFRRKLKRKRRLDRQYPGHQVYSVRIEPEAIHIIQNRSAPCKGLFTAMVNGHFFYRQYEYETVKVAEPAQTWGNGAMVLLDFKSEPLDVLGPQLDALPDFKWFQLNHSSGDKLLVKLSRHTNPNFSIQKDDVTGEGYPYCITSVYYLIKT